MLLRTQSVSTTWSQDTLEQLMTHAVNTVTKYGIKIILALLFIWIGFKLTNISIRLVKKGLERHGVDPSVVGFLASLCSILLRVLILLTAASGLGIEVTSFLTVLGSASVAVGLALQGSLSNLAGGVLILILRPYRVGDYIKTETAGIEGTVSSIDIFYTRLQSIDNQTIVIPNGKLTSSSITNVTKANDRRIDLTVDIAYEADIKTAKEVVHRVIMKEKRVQKDQPMDIFVDTLGESSVVLGIHVWVRTEDYWKTRWDLLEAMKYALDEAAIEIPYQKVDIHVKEEHN